MFEETIHFYVAGRSAGYRYTASIQMLEKSEEKSEILVLCYHLSGVAGVSHRLQVVTTILDATLSLQVEPIIILGDISSNSRIGLSSNFFSPARDSFILLPESCFLSLPHSPLKPLLLYIKFIKISLEQSSQYTSATFTRADSLKLLCVTSLPATSQHCQKSTRRKAIIEAVGSSVFTITDSLLL